MFDDKIFNFKSSLIYIAEVVTLMFKPSYLAFTYFREGTSETPETTEAARLQEMQLLLACIFTGDHILNYALNRTQYYLVVAGR